MYSGYILLRSISDSFSGLLLMKILKIKILTLTTIQNHEQANQTVYHSYRCYVFIFYCCSGTVLSAGENKNLLILICQSEQLKITSF